VSMMMPPDMAGAGAPPADPAAGGGMPPDMAGLMALLGGGGEAPAEEGPPSITEGTPGGGEEALTIALDSLQDAIDAEADQEDIQIMLQCQAKLQQILAKNQSEADKAMGGGASPAATRKMASSL
jgi:hypothetical protein